MSMINENATIGWAGAHQIQRTSERRSTEQRDSLVLARRSVGFLIFWLASFNASCQTVMPSSEAASWLTIDHYEKPEVGKEIRYYFPKSVDTILSHIMKSTMCEAWVIQMESYGDTTNLLLRCNHVVSNASEDDEELLILSTNRYYSLDTLKAMIYFDSDVKFAFPKFCHTGGALKLVFTGSAFQLGTLHAIALPKSKWLTLDSNARKQIISISSNPVIVW